MATTEYQIINTEDARISSQDQRSITIARTATSATGKLIMTTADYGVAYFFVSDDQVIQILGAVDTGSIVGIPYKINRPMWAEAVQCVVNDNNCE